MSRKILSVIVPTLNEEENVLPFYRQISPVLKGLPSDMDWELIFVNDGSTDRTHQMLLELHSAEPRVKVVRLTRNFGSYSAIRAGFEFARGDAMVSISADLQDPPELIRSLVDHWRKGSLVVWATRQDRDDPWLKSFFARCFYVVIRKLAIPTLPRDGMDYGLFDRAVITEFLRIQDKHLITFLTIYWMGFPQAMVPYRREKRERGTSKWPLGKRINSALDVITSFSFSPIRMASYLGVGLSALALVGAVVVIVDKVVFHVGGMGWPSLMVIILFMGGAQLIMLGMIGEYLWRIGSQVRGLPSFVVHDKTGF